MMTKRCAFLLTLLILVPIILAACGGGNDKTTEVELTSDSLTSAYEALLAGDAGPAKALTCKGQQASIDAFAETIQTAREKAPDSVVFTVTCEVHSDKASCDISKDDDSQLPQTLAFDIVNGKVCEIITP